MSSGYESLCSSQEDDCCVVPRSTPENQRILREIGYMVPLRNSQDLSSSPVYTAVLIPAVKQKPRGSLIQQHQATEPQQPVDEPFSMLRSRPIPIKRKATA